MTADRKPRCRVTSRRTKDPCPNEAISDFGMCLTHLQEAHAEYEQILHDAAIKFLERSRDE